MLRIFQEDAPKPCNLTLDECRLTKLVEAALGEICSEDAEFVHLL